MRSRHRVWQAAFLKYQELARPNGRGGVVVGNQVDITIDVEATLEDT